MSPHTHKRGAYAYTLNPIHMISMPLQSCLFFRSFSSLLLPYSLATWQTRLFYNPRQLRSQMGGVFRCGLLIRSSCYPLVGEQHPPMWHSTCFSVRRGYFAPFYHKLARATRPWRILLVGANAHTHTQTHRVLVEQFSLAKRGLVVESSFFFRPTSERI